MSPKKLRIESENAAANFAVRLFNLREVINESNRTKSPISEALKTYLEAHPGTAIENEGMPTLELVEKGAGTDVDCATMAEKDAALLMELARRGALRVDWQAAQKLMGSGQIVWPTMHGHRLYTMPKSRTELRFTDDDD